DHLGEMRDRDLQTEVGDRAAHVGGNQVEQFFRHGREAPYFHIPGEHHDGDVHVLEQVQQVVIELLEFLVPVLQLLVDRGQFFIGGLQFFLGGFQLFVGAL